MPVAKPISLSKSKLNAYHQCKKRLWLEVHRRDLLEASAATSRIFAVGQQVGSLARAEHADGILVPNDLAWSEAEQQTQAALAAQPKRPVFEAAVSHAGVCVRSDLLIPRGSGFHLAEVKSTTSVKDYHLPDAAVQVWVLRSAGVPVKSVELRHINREFVYPGYGDYRRLFASGDIQDAVEKLQPDVPKWVEDARAILGRAEPDVAMGGYCDAPFECPFKVHCASVAGPRPRYPVTLLKGKNGKRLAEELAQEGIDDLRNVPVSRLGDDEKLHRIHAAVKSGQPFLDPAARRAIAAWPYPRYHLDFETINFAVPRWAGTQPYEQVPFQWSCHIDAGEGELEHVAFLDLSGGDPSRACAEALIKALGTRGAVIAYNAGFEKGVISRLAERFPDLREQLRAINARVVDLLPIVRKHYYHRDLFGSFSMKAVLPTVALKMDYAELDEVQDGEAAQMAYLEAIQLETAEARRQALRAKLLAYCERDTLAMIEVEKALARGASEMMPVL